MNLKMPDRTVPPKMFHSNFWLPKFLNILFFPDMSNELVATKHDGTSSFNPSMLLEVDRFYYQAI